MIIDLAFEQQLQERTEEIDRAAAWAFAVYRRIVQRTRNDALAGRIANRVYAKILEREGENGDQRSS